LIYRCSDKEVAKVYIEQKKIKDQKKKKKRELKQQQSSEQPSIS